MPKLLSIRLEIKLDFEWQKNIFAAVIALNAPLNSAVHCGVKRTKRKRKFVRATQKWKQKSLVYVNKGQRWGRC